MSRSPLEYLRHILDEANYLASNTVKLTRERFLADETAKRAFARSVEVIGEAAKHVPQALRDVYPDVARHVSHARQSDSSILWR